MKIAQMNSSNLVEYLSKVPDIRRGAGQRHNHTFVLLIVLMSTMSGYHGYRSIGSFISRNKAELLQYFHPPKNRLPSFYTVRRILQNLDFDMFSAQFYQWARNYISVEEGDWISMDGKAIRGTVTNGSTSQQHFINLVSLYCNRQKMVLGNGLVETSKDSEIPVVRQLIEALDIKGVTFTLDALHCQKKRQKSLLPAEITI